MHCPRRDREVLRISANHDEPSYGPPDHGEMRRHWPVWAGCVLLGALGAGLLGYWAWSSQSERRAIHDLPISERRAFYHRTLENLRSVCSNPDAATLSDFCRSEGELVLLFPECDTPCQELVRRQLPRAAR